MDMKIKCKCYSCRKSFVVKCHRDDYDTWKTGEKLIQEALFYLSAGDRELLLSGICNDCWEKLFGSCDNEEEF